MVETSVGAPVLLYDGVCGFSNKSVQLILDHDRRGALRFAALQSDYGQAVIERHAELRGVDSVVFVEGHACAPIELHDAGAADALSQILVGRADHHPFDAGIRGGPFRGRCEGVVGLEFDHRPDRDSECAQRVLEQREL